MDSDEILGCVVRPSVATHRESHAGEVKDDDQDQKGYTYPSDCGLRREAKTSPT
jgi:hypothetical protein